MSLEVPEGFYRFNWIGVDPGLTNCGTSVYRVNGRQITSISPRTIANNRIGYGSHIPAYPLGDRRTRLDLLFQAFARMVYEEQPIAVACESPFFNSRMPNAFGSLVETVSTLRYAVESINPNIPFILYAPHEVKKAFSAKSMKGKDAMLDALKENQRVCSLLDTPFESLDEHAIDATAVGYTWIINQPGGQQWF